MKQISKSIGTTNNILINIIKESLTYMLIFAWARAISTPQVATPPQIAIHTPKKMETFD